MKVTGMTRKKSFSKLMTLAFAGSLALAGCDSNGVSTSGTVYYDSMLWNDYYYGSYRPGYRPPPDRPDRPVRPPSGGIDPGFSRPPVARPPVHRPSGGGGRGRR